MRVKVELVRVWSWSSYLVSRGLIVLNLRSYTLIHSQYHFPMDAMDILNGCRPTIAATSHPRDLSRLKRMPHLFSRVLELPLHAETPVSVVESRDCYRFQVRLPGALVDEVKVEVLEIVPGATKVLVRGVDKNEAGRVSEVNLWRFRLPPTTVPEKSVASYEQEFLSVTIPKSLVSCNDDLLDSKGKNDGDADMDVNSSDTEYEFETEEERMQREVLEHLESFGSPRRTRSSPPSCSSSLSLRKCFESEVDLEKLQNEVLEDLESFGSPRRRSASCTQALNVQSTGSQDFFRSVGSWVGGFTVSVQ